MFMTVPDVTSDLSDERITAFGMVLEATRRLERIFARSLQEQHGLPMVEFEALLRLGRSAGCARGQAGGGPLAGGAARRGTGAPAGHVLRVLSSCARARVRDACVRGGWGVGQSRASTLPNRELLANEITRPKL